jgi:hypothetical protein
VNTNELKQAVRAALERAILTIARDRGVVCADNVRAVIPIPVSIDPRIVGRAFLALKNDGLIVEVGSRHTHRPIAHSRMLRLWVLSEHVDRIEARLAQPAPSMWPERRTRSLFDDLDASETNAGATTAIVPPADSSTVNHNATGDHGHGSTC